MRIEGRKKSEERMKRKGEMKRHTERLEVALESGEDNSPVWNNDCDEEGGGARTIDHHLIDGRTAGVCSV